MPASSPPNLAAALSAKVRSSQTGSKREFKLVFKKPVVARAATKAASATSLKKSAVLSKSGPQDPIALAVHAAPVPVKKLLAPAQDREPRAGPFGVLPETGFVRLPTILQVYPISRAGWWKC